MSQMDTTVVLFIVGGLSTALVALFGWLIHSYEGRIKVLEHKIASIELQIATRLSSIEAKLEQLIER